MMQTDQSWKFFVHTQGIITNVIVSDLHTRKNETTIVKVCIQSRWLGRFHAVQPITTVKEYPGMLLRHAARFHCSWMTFPSHLIRKPRWFHRVAQSPVGCHSEGLFLV